MISRFFIDRPIFASVLSIVITLAGGIALWTLPLALYPPISPPTVQVDCNYPGASAQTVAESVATPIEQQVNGVENMLYMSSQCTNDGSYNLTVTFKHGVNLNMAQVLVQNRVSLALPNLPDVIKQTGVNVRKKSPDILLSIALNSPSDAYDQLYLSNYAVMHLKEELARLPGVSDVNMFGQRDYSMRIWVDPDRIAARDMTAGDVVAAVRAQNAPVAAGQIGQQPVPKGQAIQYTLSTLGRLAEPEQFEDIVIKATPDGRVTRLKDVARVELGAKNQDIDCRVNGRPSASLAIFQLPDANALDVAKAVKAKVKELEKDFPEGLRTEIRYDTTPYISDSIGEVYKTLFEAIILVALVVLLFLQNWRSALIPLVAVPVAIIGTFAVMAVFGFTLNNLTLFGLVLAIGIVVDDAIVVVEAVEHHIEHGLPPRAATVAAMHEVSGPVIAIGLVLSAVFVPCAFITGIVGQFFRQFALTIAASTIISAFNSLTLSPALAAILLRPRDREGDHEVLPRLGYVLIGGWLGWELLTPLLAARIGSAGLRDVAVAVLAGAALGWLAMRPCNRILSAFFRLFNKGFVSSTKLYARVVGGLLRVSALVVVVYAGLLFLTHKGFMETPTGFIPSQDMGYLLCNVQLPDSASLERTVAAMNRMELIAKGTPGVKHTQINAGQSLLLSANGSNFGSMFVVLDEFSRRPVPLLDRFFPWLDEAAVRLDHLFKEKVYRPLGWNWPERRLASLLEAPITKGRGQAQKKGRKFEDLFRGWLRQPKKPSLYSEAIADVIRKRFAQGISTQEMNEVVEELGKKGVTGVDAEELRGGIDAMVTVLPPPPLRGVGRAGGFKLMVEDRGDNGPANLQERTEKLTDAAKKQPDLTAMTSVFRANVPQLYADVNRAECLAKEVALKDLNDTLRIYLGSLYVNDFNKFGRTWQVIVQADSRFRDNVESVKRLKVRNARGAMVPVGALADINEVNGPLLQTRYNMYPAAPLNGNAAVGVSSGQAIATVQELARNELPQSMAFEWTELAYLELQAGNTAIIVFGCAVAMVFLVLAAQYESWSLPLAVILVVPMCLLSAVTGVIVSFQDINIFTQIGFVVLVGLASKNAILIVEFAKARRAAGETRRQAALDACKLRLRPIVMTSLAFILGVVPLILSNGAGAEMRRTLGVTVFSGMLGVTAFGVFLTPVFFSVVDWLGGSRVFALPLVRRVSDIALGTLSLSYVRKAMRPSSRPAPVTAPRSRPVVPAVGDGNGQGNGNGDGHETETGERELAERT